MPHRTGTGVPPWSMAVVAMLAVQLSNALSVPVIEQVGPAGTAWLRMCFGVVFLWMIARPAIRSLRRRRLHGLTLDGRPVLMAKRKASGDAAVRAS